MSEATILFLSFGVLLLMGGPIALALGAAAMITFLHDGQDLSSLVQIAFSSVNSFPIMALPAFVLAGALMECAGISRRLVRIAEAMIGRITGGLAITTTLACVFFGAISGSGPATTAAVGMLMIPAMIRKGYDRGYAAAATGTSGGLGIIIPPSIPMVIYGVTSQQSITKMFLAGVFPGLLIASAMVVMHYIICKTKHIALGDEEFDYKKLLATVKEGFLAILAPVVILGGIYSGIFTPTEAAIVAIFYTLFIGIFVYKEVTLKGIAKSLETTSWLTGRVLIIMFTAYSFGRILVQYKIPDVIAESLLNFTTDTNIIWILVVAFLIFMGMFMETLAIIMIVTPVLLPVMVALGVDPIHFGIILICCLSLGFSTPPLGENMFISSGIAQVTLEEISVKSLPFIAISLVSIMIMVVFPQTVLWLPSFFGY
jgi:C4-dicarboxylate transporter DctM subunit